MKLETAPQDVMIGNDFEQRDVAIGDVAFILDMFADKVYSNKERAVIRELSCNAHDSHVMAGTTEIPFDVHLPTQLEPWFSLRDYGTGLEDDDIANVYGAIGVSTKRDSNEVIGCFGIGSLSPYSMCDSFTVKSYRNGTVRTYQCMRDDKRQPKVIPLGVASTDEPNGLEVKLTVNGKVSQFETEAENVFLFWEGTLPNINNQHVVRKCEQQREAYIFKGDDFGLTPSWGNMKAVMGNIAYSIPSQLDEFDCEGYLKFELGELEFDTARENLSITDKTKAALVAKFKSVKDSLADIAKEQIEEKDSDFEKAKLAEKLRGGQIGRFVGRKMLDEYVLPEPTESLTYWQSKYRGSEKYSTRIITTDADFYLEKPRMQTRIKEYLKQKNSGFTMFIFKDLAQAMECKIPVELLKDLDDLPKVQRTSSGGTKSTCKTLMFVTRNRGWGYTDAEYWNETSIELDSSDEIVYVEVNRNKPVTNSRWTETNSQLTSTLATAKGHGIEVELIGLKTAFLNTAAFRKGNFISIDDYLRREYTKIAPKVLYTYDQNDLDRLRDIGKRIDQSELNDIIELADGQGKTDIAEVCNRLCIKLDQKEDTSLQDLMDKFNEKYYMLSLIDGYRIRTNPTMIAQYISGKVR